MLELRIQPREPLARHLRGRQVESQLAVAQADDARKAAATST
jgi:hypothetical protein